MDIAKTIGTKEQQILIDRVGEQLAEISGSNKLSAKGFIRKNLEKVLGDSSMKEVAADPAEARMKIFIETAKLTGHQLKLTEKQTLDTTLSVYDDWKKEFGR